MPISRYALLHLFFLCAFVPAFVACSTRPSNSLSDAATEIDWSVWGLETSVDQSETIAGETVMVQCDVQAPADAEDTTIP